MARRCIECAETVIKDVQDARRVFPTESRTLRNVKESRQRKKNEPILCAVTAFSNCIFFLARVISKRKQKSRKARRRAMNGPISG